MICSDRIVEINSSSLPAVARHTQERKPMAWSLCTTSIRSTIAARLILAAIALVAAVQIAYFEIYFNSVTSLTEDLDISFFSNGNGSRNKIQNPTAKGDVRLIHQHNIQGSQIENRNSTGGQVHSRPRASSFPWDRDNTCYVVENICNIRKSQWLYFTDDTTSSKPKQPPKLSMLGRLGPYISPNWPKEAASQLQRKKCTISNITNHLVVTGKHIRMMGEYYQRIMLPLHHLMQDYMSYSNATTSEKEVQYYIHFSDPNQKILDSHYLYTMGLPNGGRNEVHWLETLKHWVETVSNVKSCQCYRRLVFCGYTDNAPSNEKNTTVSLAPYHGIADNFEKHCNAEYSKRAKDLELENCTVWQDLRMSLLRMYEITHPDLLQDVHAYRKMLIDSALMSFDTKPTKPTIIEQDWKVIGISQRSDRRKWLNINDTISHCNIKYHVLKIACVEVDVSDLPTKFTSTRTNRSLTSVEEQLVFYRSIDALIGIHGAQLTQGVLMKSNSVVTELLPWVPPITHWNYPVHGDGWVNQKNHPT